MHVKQKHVHQPMHNSGDTRTILFVDLLSRPIATICVQFVGKHVNATALSINSFSCISTLSSGWGGCWIYVGVTMKILMRHGWTFM